MQLRRWSRPLTKTCAWRAAAVLGENKGLFWQAIHELSLVPMIRDKNHAVH